ncbi:MAG: TolC family protein [Candidatus Latescibacterota bacterium]
MNMQCCLITALSIATLATPSGAEVWTLDRTVQAALESSAEAEVDRLQAESALLDARSAGMGWRPTLSTTVAANYVSEVMEVNLPGGSIRFGDNESFDFRLRLNQLLYDGGRLDALRQAGRSRAEASRHQAEAAGLAAEFRAKTAFYSVAAGQENIQAAEQSIREAQSHLKTVTALREQGMALEDDVLLSRLRVSQAEMNLISRRAERERAEASFRQAAGLPSDAEVSVEWKPLPLALPDSTAVETAWRLRPEFEAFESALQTAEFTARSARADRRPNIGLAGGFNYGRPGLNLPANDWMHWFSAGVSLNWNIWDWGRVDREVEKAEITRQITIENRDDLRLMIARQVSEALAGFREAERRNALAQQSGEYAQRHLELVKVSFQNGEATERDYDAAHARYTQALHDAAAARIALQISRAQVEYVLGIRYTGGSNG